MVFGTYSDFEECDFCTDRYTTKCFVNCKIYNIKNAIHKLNNYITNRIDLNDDIIVVNKKFKQYLDKYSKLNFVPNIIVYKTDVLNNDTIVVIISKKALNNYNK